MEAVNEEFEEFFGVLLPVDTPFFIEASAEFLYRNLRLDRKDGSAKGHDLLGNLLAGWCRLRLPSRGSAGGCCTVQALDLLNLSNYFFECIYGKRHRGKRP